MLLTEVLRAYVLVEHVSFASVYELKFKSLNLTSFLMYQLDTEVHAVQSST